MTKKKEIFEKLMNCANMFEDMGKSLQTASEIFLMKFLTDNQDFFEEYYPLSEGKRVFRTGKDFNYLYKIKNTKNQEEDTYLAFTDFSDKKLDFMGGRYAFHKYGVHYTLPIGKYFFNKMLEEINELDLRIGNIEKEDEENVYDVLSGIYNDVLAKLADKLFHNNYYIYNPKEVSRLIKRILFPIQEYTIYNAAGSTGELAIEIAKGVKNAKVYGDTSAMDESMKNIMRINMYLSRIKNYHIKNDDPLYDPFVDEDDRLMKFDVAVANLMFPKEKWSIRKKTRMLGGEKIKKPNKNDPYKRLYRDIKPKYKDDWAYIQHMMKSLEDYGTLVVLASKTLLYEEGYDEKVRKRMLMDNYVDTVIRLPDFVYPFQLNPVCIVVFKKLKSDRKVMIIDYEQHMVRQNEKDPFIYVLEDEVIEKMYEASSQRKEIKGFSHLATMDEIAMNDYKLTPARYMSGLEKLKEYNRERAKIIEENKDNLLEKLERADNKINDLLEKMIPDTPKRSFKANGHFQRKINF